MASYRAKPPTPRALFRGSEKSRTSGSKEALDLLAPPERLPHTIPLLPVGQTTLFPGMVVPLLLPEGRLPKTVDFALERDGIVGVVLAREPVDGTVASAPNAPGGLLGGEEGTVEAGTAESVGPFLRFGVAAKVVKKLNLPDNQVSVLVSGLQRFFLEEITAEEPHPMARVHYLPEKMERGTELEALLRSALAQFKQIAKDNPLISEEVKVALVNIDGPGKLTDFMTSVLLRDMGAYQRFLAEGRVRERLQQLLLLLKKEGDVQALQRKIQDDINQKVSSAQREFLLNEQLKLIQKELGRHGDERVRLAEKFEKRLAGKVIPAATRERLDEELEKLNALHEQSSEFSVAVNYLDWLTTLPWGVHTTDRFDLRRARQRLDEDHYGLEDVKERVLEFLAVRKRRPEGRSTTILCLLGPPGTGKTSLGRSIARTLGRKFARFSVGGMRDEAEIKGHRRTYVGAMPGKMVQAFKRAGSQNPVFLIDEIDKVGASLGTGGDPASALLELLDPEQNREFIDHYLDVPVDCSQVFFVTTANSLDSVPPALLDRLEVIQLSGYTDLEKGQIALRYLLPKLEAECGLGKSDFRLGDRALDLLLTRYAREAGVRNLERQLARLCRKAAYRLETGRAQRVSVTTEKQLEKMLGPAPFPPEKPGRTLPPGVAMGLAWTAYGGEVLQVETLAVPAPRSNPGLVLTGTLGKVMQESAAIAESLVRGLVPIESLATDFFEKHAIHVHVPSGATPKDGPSAGVTLVVAFYSLLLGKRLPKTTAMTGEVTLTGRVLAVGGIKEKVLAARRNGVKTVLVPKENERDVRLLPVELRRGMKFVFLATVQDALGHFFPGVS